MTIYKIKYKEKGNDIINDIKELENKIYNEDCISSNLNEGINRIPDNFIDLITTDPPYGIDYQSNYKKEKFNKIKNDNNLNWFQGFSNECYRALKNNSALYCFTRPNVYPYMFQCFINSGFKFKNLIIVPKSNIGGNGDLQASFSVGYELIIYLNKGRRKFEESKILKPSDTYLKDKRKNPKEYLYRLPAYWDWCKSTEHNLKMLHPTQKSVEVFDTMIQVSSKENEIVLDPFIGVGTCAISCIKNNRNYIGFELDDTYYDLCQNRINTYLKSK